MWKNHCPAIEGDNGNNSMNFLHCPNPPSCDILMGEDNGEKSIIVFPIAPSHPIPWNNGEKSMSIFSLPLPTPPPWENGEKPLIFPHCLMVVGVGRYLYPLSLPTPPQWYNGKKSMRFPYCLMEVGCGWVGRDNWENIIDFSSFSSPTKVGWGGTMGENQWFFPVLFEGG